MVLDLAAASSTSCCFKLILLDHAPSRHHLVLERIEESLRGDNLFKFASKGWGWCLHELGDRHRHRGGFKGQSFWWGRQLLHPFYRLLVYFCLYHVNPGCLLECLQSAKLVSLALDTFE